MEVRGQCWVFSLISEHLTIFKKCVCGGGVGGRPLHMSEDDLRGQKKVLDPWEFALGL